MARTSITPTTVVKEGVLEPSTAPGTVDGKMFANDGNTFVILSNVSVDTDHIVTFVTTKTDSGLALADLPITVAFGTKKVVGPFSQGLFNQATGSDVGKVYINFVSTESDIEVQVFHLG